MFRGTFTLESNHYLHEVIIMEAIQEYMNDRGHFCYVRVKKIDEQYEQPWDVKKYVGKKRKIK